MFSHIPLYSPGSLSALLPIHSSSLRVRPPLSLSLFNFETFFFYPLLLLCCSILRSFFSCSIFFFFFFFFLFFFPLIVVVVVFLANALNIYTYSTVFSICFYDRCFFPLTLFLFVLFLLSLLLWLLFLPYTTEFRMVPLSRALWNPMVGYSAIEICFVAHVLTFWCLERGLEFFSSFFSLFVSTLVCFFSVGVARSFRASYVRTLSPVSNVWTVSKLLQIQFKWIFLI